MRPSFSPAPGVQNDYFLVMAGLVPAIYVFLLQGRQDVDARDICAKTRFAL
jgi:hypothetical protein